MLPFPIKIQPGQPIYEQIVHAVKRAIAAGRLLPGDRFPAVRTISKERNVNPNTVQKAVSELTAKRFLDVHPGQGCFVAPQPASRRDIQVEALRPLIERLLIEAVHHGVTEDQLLNLIHSERGRLHGQRD